MATQRFRYATSILKRSAFLTVTGSFLLVLLASTFLLLDLPNLEELELSQLYLNENGDVYVEVPLFSLVLLISTIVLLAKHKIRLVLTNEGLTINIPRLTGLGFWGLTTGSHRIPLSAIQSVELAPASGVQNIPQAIQKARLSIITREKTYRLQPYNFLREGGPDHRMGFGALFGKSQSKAEALLAEAPLVQALSLATNNLSFTTTPTDDTGPLAGHFDLLQHKGMVIQLLLLAGLGIYALVDYLLLTNFLVVGEWPLWPFVFAGLLASALGIHLGKGAPKAEHIGLAIILGLAGAVAVYPGLQRYTLIAASAPIEITYQMTKTGYFEHASYPSIDQRESGITEYWESLTLGANYSFSLYEPVMGFTMVDMAPVYAKSRAFYEAAEQ
ncbi:hypothetical protein [Marinobacter sp. S6332]|uniref:hypothetical protein n=1 Tax=Marinobacter sp. S6332 TaxID=2926403 RepID=UPI001FF5F5EC|nr:hypothetical protein [Marinobacter sp. S6332]MCK0162880.1 hypothetical protein [Marinobacter sp. S6332]